MTTAAKPGDTVAVHFTGKLADGSVVDSSMDRDPVQFVLGKRRVLPGLEKAVTGMSPGETKTATLPVEDAYGPHRPELVVRFTRDRIPADLPADVGQQVQLKTKDGQALPAVVVDASDHVVTFDANHPLAGKELTYEIELVDVLANS